MDGPAKYDPDWLRHHAHPLALCRRGSGQQLIRELGLCSAEEWGRSLRQVRNAKARNRYWAALGYPNLVRARAAKREAERRRKLLGLRARDHSLDHVLEYAAQLIPPRELCADDSIATAPLSTPPAPDDVRFSFAPAVPMVRPSRRL